METSRRNAKNEIPEKKTDAMMPRSSASDGVNGTSVEPPGPLRASGPDCRNPQDNAQFPKTLLKTTTAVMTTVLRWTRDLRLSSTGACGNLVARVGGDSRLPVLRHEL